MEYSASQTRPMGIVRFSLKVILVTTVVKSFFVSKGMSFKINKIHCANRPSV